MYDIPPQLQMGTEKEVLEGVTETTQETTQFVFSSNLIINNLLYGSANGLW